MKLAHGGNAITLAGPPGNMAAVTPLAVAARTIIPVTIRIAGQPAIQRASVRPFGNGRSEIRLRLPLDTPPGTYDAEGVLDGKPLRMVVEVEPVIRIRVHPRQTRVSAAPHARVEFGLSIVNSGNVPFVVPKSDAFDLDDTAGQDRALGRSLRAADAPGERRADQLFEELRQSHGGEARVAVLRGPGRIEPGETGELACVLDVPDMAKAEHSYLGAWQLGNAGHVIVVDVTGSTTRGNGEVTK